MSDDKVPSDALFLQLGKFKAGAFGVPAVLTLGIIAGAVIIWRLL